MSGAAPARAVDWLGACRRAAAVVRGNLGSELTAVERAREVGTTGHGGDRTLVIDSEAEDAVLAELDVLHAQGARFTIVTEERGTIERGGDGILVVVDPIDGSTNARRGLPSYALSIAVADGPTMADVFFGYVMDFGPGEEWVARRGEGALLNDRPLARDAAEHRKGNGKIELLGVESADPRWMRDAADVLADTAYRLRVVGAIAVSLCQVAAARFDGMVTLRNCRAVDAAAAQLIVREAGGEVAFTRCPDPLGAPLDVEPRSPVVAARTRATLAELATIPL